jgi:hypothetical protein
MGGLATRATVLGLLALAAWAAAASHRAVVSELRAAASHLRAAEAFEAAQGGLEFTLALLHAGPVDATCQPAPGSAPAPSLAEQLVHAAAELGCQRLDSGWACRCPQPGVAEEATPAAAVAPGFRVEVMRVGTSDALQLRATGRGSGPASVATVSVLVAPQPGTSAPTWRQVPGSWRDF